MLCIGYYYQGFHTTPVLHGAGNARGKRVFQALPAFEGVNYFRIQFTRNENAEGPTIFTLSGSYSFIILYI